MCLFVFLSLIGCLRAYTARPKNPSKMKGRLIDYIAY